ncbi:hypothetical protein IGB00_35135, partial [Pseudomonas aeruginosa]|nr:hypothetical protein [Pseudomonas aeruginosa]
QGVLHNATGALMAFYDGKQTAEQTLDAIRAGLESLAWHHGNVDQELAVSGGQVAGDQRQAAGFLQ